MEKTIRSSGLIRVVAAGALAASLGLGAVTSAHADPGGNSNKGTIKTSLTGIREDPSGGSDEPKVCAPFFVQGYKIADVGKTLQLEFTDQGNQPTGGDGVNGTQVGPLDAVTIDSTGYFNYEVTTLAAQGLVDGGHYKVELTDATNKEKSKVFKIECNGVPGGGGGGATPELSSGELLATGLLPIGAILLYRRRRNRRAS